MAKEKIAVALRILAAVNRYTLPDEQDLENLRSLVDPDMRDWASDELARDIISQELARRKPDLGEMISPSSSGDEKEEHWRNGKAPL